MRTLIVALVIALGTLSAQAQDYGIGGVAKSGHKGRDTAVQNDAQKKQRVEAERASKKALDQLPDKPYDPWQNVRP